MKYVIFAALSLFSVMASAYDNAPANQEQYSYGQKLDIAKVISVEAAESNLCEPVAASMVYEDSKGVEHELHYLRESEACSRG